MQQWSEMRPGDKKRLEHREKILRLYAEGMSTGEIAKLVDRNRSRVKRVRQLSPAGPRNRRKQSLSEPEREEISLALKGGLSVRAIGRKLKRAVSTISREVKGNRVEDGGYRAYQGEARATIRARRPKGHKLAKLELKLAVEERLKKDWSPQQISGQLRKDYPDNPEMNVSHESIYRALYVQARGGLKRELSEYLRTQRSARKPLRTTPATGVIKGMVNISQRPAEAADRAVPGHWEGDLIMGKNNNSAIGTLVERSTRFVMLLFLNGDRTSENVCNALAKKIETLPAHLKRSVTWDQGTEMAKHASFTVKSGVDVYFCDPRSPWQRGSNENTNGLLRQYFPKGIDLSQFDEAHLDMIADRLNTRPRQTLCWATPSRRLQALVALTG